MPRIRKDTSWTPSSLLNESFDIDDADFIQDPDQYRDQLPQPYRMINKVLVRILDQVWDHISDRESDRIADASRFRPPQYECAVSVQDDSNTVAEAECLAATPDGEFIVLGLQKGLCVVKASNYTVVDIWSEESLHITSIQTCHLAENKYLITTTDDMGAFRLHALAGEQIFSVTTVSEPESGGKAIVSGSELSTHGDFLAIFTEKPSSGESWVEVLKLPKEAWIKDLDALISKANRKDTSQTSQQTAKSPVPQEDAPVENANPSEGQDPSMEKSTENLQEGSATEEQREQRSQSPANQRSSHTFTAASVIMKVLPPGEVAGATYSSVQSACKNIDTHGDVIGTGAHHLLSAAHLDHRKDMFEQIHSDLIKYLPEGDTKITSQAAVHFLCPGRVLSQGIGANPRKPDSPSSIAIWWSKDTQLMVYSLHKHAKELERKPDLVLPLSSNIVASGVSADGSQVALAMANNNIVVWDMYMTTPRGVIHLGDQNQVTKITFLDPSVCPQSGASYPPYPTTTSCYIMVAMDDGHVRLVNCGQMGSPPVLLDLNIVKPDELPTLCLPVDGIPDLLLTCRKNGCVYLHDLHRGNQICEVILPADYELVTPWQPPIAVGAKGGMLYIKGQPRPVSQPATSDPAGDDDDGHQVEQEVPHKLFVFQLRSFPTLDKYRSRERPEVPFVVHSVVENRINSLFQERMSQQSSRVTRMQARWDNLKNEVELLQQLREERQKKAQRNAFLSSGQ